MKNVCYYELYDIERDSEAPACRGRQHGCRSDIRYQYQHSELIAAQWVGGTTAHPPIIT
jgi:hypothetical protein